LRDTESENLLDQALRRCGVHGLAHARFLEHGNDGALRLRADLGGADEFLGGGNALDLPGLGGERFQLGVDLGLRLGFRDGRLIGGDVEPLVAVDPDFLDAALVNAHDVLRIGQHEAAAPERVLHPGAAELLDVHAEGEVVHADSLEHLAGAEGERRQFIRFGIGRRWHRLAAIGIDSPVRRGPEKAKGPAGPFAG